VQMLRRMEAVLANFDGMVALSFEVARRSLSFGRSQRSNGLSVESLDLLALLAILDSHFEEVSGTERFGRFLHHHSGLL
jgi:hypothetical protein